MPKIPPDDPPKKVKDTTKCIACGGKGKSSKGSECYPCKGTGKIRQYKFRPQ